MALGATQETILRYILYCGMVPVLTGMAIGVAAAFFSTHVLGGMLFAVKTTDPLTFAAIAAFLILVALVACCIPARRATHIDPMKAWRMD